MLRRFMSKRLRSGVANDVGRTASDLTGRWELLTPEHGQKSVTKVDELLPGASLVVQEPLSESAPSPLPLLCADLQDIQVRDGKVVISATGRFAELGSLELQVGSSGTTPVSRKSLDAQQGVICFGRSDQVLGDRLCFEYDCPQGHVLDERRVLHNGSRLEQKVSLLPNGKSDSATLIERRYFRRQSSTLSIARELAEHQKYRLLFGLLLSQVPLMLLVPSWMWGLFIFLFHLSALVIVLIWSPVESRQEGGETGVKQVGRILDASSSCATDAVSRPQKRALPLADSGFYCDRRLSELSSLASSSAPTLRTSGGSTDNMSSGKSSSGGKTNRMSTPVVRVGRLLDFNHRRKNKSGPKNEVAPYKVDVFVSVQQVRKRSKRFSTYSEFQLLVRANKPGGRSWTVWHSYGSILSFHRHLQSILESEETRKSRFARVVPPVPERHLKFLSISRGKREYEDLLSRRMAGLSEFFLRLFGPESDPALRLKALADTQVQRFFGVI